MKRKIISTLIIILGISIMIYPKASELYNDYQQEKLIQGWKESILNVEQDYMEDENDDINYDVDEINVETIKENLLSKKNKREKEIESRRREEEARKQEYIKKNMEGILKIEKINLDLPILSGATQGNLKISVASIRNTGKPGQLGNYAIAGHRNRTYGRNFNRLDEVEEGDIIEVDIEKGNYIYTVVEKIYVKPEETWVLNGNNENREITLVTCHPMINPTHRLIVKGKIIE